MLSTVRAYRCLSLCDRAGGALAVTSALTGVLKQSKAAAQLLEGEQAAPPEGRVYITATHPPTHPGMNDKRTMRI